MLDSTSDRLVVPRKPLSETNNETSWANTCSGPKGTSMMATITELTMENIVRKAMEYRIGSSSVSMDLEPDSSLASLDDMISEKVRLPSGGGGSADLTCMPADTMGGGSVIIGE